MGCAYNVLNYMTENPMQKNFYLHAHEHLEIYWFLEGDSKFLVEGKEYSLRPGDVIVVKGRQMHRVYHNSMKTYRRMVLEVHGTFFGKNNCYGYKEAIESLESNKIDSDIVQSSGLQDAFMRLKKYTEDFTELDTTIAKCTVVEILYLIVKIKAYSKGKVINQTLMNVMDYINRNFTKNITLDYLGKKYFISKYHLCHVFMQATGLTVHQFITTKRLLFANELIKDGKNIGDAAIQAGFSSYSAFYRAYVKEYGFSPRESEKYGNVEEVVPED